MALGAHIKMPARLKADAARARRLAANLDPRDPGHLNLLNFAAEMEAQAAQLEADQAAVTAPPSDEPPASASP